ncbi:MAG: NAD-dependent epimerase/dehydratase family protein [Candidatus Amoebophilus sp.]
MLEFIRQKENYIIREDIEKIIFNKSIPWMLLGDKTILVSGGAGFLASYLIKSILAANKYYNLNLKIIALVRNKNKINYRFSSWINDKNLSFIECNISDSLPISLPKADIVIHAASQASPKFYGVDPIGTLLSNTVGTLNLLNYAKISNTKKFIFFSSSEVYGRVNCTSQIKENDYGYLDPIKIQSCYAESKRMGENICASWSKQFNAFTTIIRPFHTYGPGLLLDDGRVFADFIADIINNRDIILKSDGMAKRSFCYISDAIVGFLTIILKGENSEAYNVGNPDAEISMKELAATLVLMYPEKKINLKFNVQNNDSFLRSDIQRICPDISKIKLLGWYPEIGIEEGFTRTVNSFIEI